MTIEANQQQDMVKTSADTLAQYHQEPLLPTEERGEKAARIRSALQQFAHLQISTEEYLREKHAELAHEHQLEGA